MSTRFCDADECDRKAETTIHDVLNGKSFTVDVCEQCAAEMDRRGWPMSTAEAELRYENAIDLADHCNFCGSENMTTDSRVEGVKQHSHSATRVDTIACEDCGGAFQRFGTVTARATSAGPPGPSGTCWLIPDGYLLIVCPDCGEILEERENGVEENQTFFERLVDGDVLTPCGVPATDVQGKYGRHADGEPWKDLQPADRESWGGRQ